MSQVARRTLHVLTARFPDQAKGRTGAEGEAVRGRVRARAGARDSARARGDKPAPKSGRRNVRGQEAHFISLDYLQNTNQWQWQARAEEGRQLVEQPFNKTRSSLNM